MLTHERPDILRHCYRALTGETFSAGYEVNGRLIDVRFLQQRNPDGTPAGVISVAIDAAERVQA